MAIACAQLHQLCLLGVADIDEVGEFHTMDDDDPLNSVYL